VNVGGEEKKKKQRERGSSTRGRQKRAEGKNVSTGNRRDQTIVVVYCSSEL
jgi:hypothetical protein